MIYLNNPECVGKRKKLATIGAVKEYLSLGTEADLLVKEQLLELDELKDLAANVDEMRMKSKAEVREILNKIYSAEEKVNRTIDSYVDIKTEIADFIDMLGNAEMRNILGRHYLLGHPWEKIAEDCFISVRSVYNIHNRAVKSLLLLSNGIAG